MNLDSCVGVSKGGRGDARNQCLHGRTTASRWRSVAAAAFSRGCHSMIRTGERSFHALFVTADAGGVIAAVAACFMSDPKVDTQFATRRFRV